MGLSAGVALQSDAVVVALEEAGEASDVTAGGAMFGRQFDDPVLARDQTKALAS